MLTVIKTLSYTFASKDSGVAIPIFRFGMSDEFKMTLTDNKDVKQVNIDLYELANFAEEGSDTRMLLTLYLAYANVIY